MGMDLEDIELERLLADKQHKELILAIKQLGLSLKKDDTKDNEVIKTVQSNSKALEIFLNKLSEISKSETKAPVVNVETNQSDVVKEAKLIIENQQKIIELLQKKPTRLTVRRNSQNTIDFIDINYETIKTK